MLNDLEKNLDAVELDDLELDAVSGGLSNRPSTCPSCHGQGKLADGKSCPKCGGKGTV